MATKTHLILAFRANLNHPCSLNQLKVNIMKIRKNFLAILLAIIITSVTFFIVFNLPAPSVSEENKNWLTGWNNRKSHIILGSPSAGTNYQIKITTHYQKGTDSGSDVFTLIQAAKPALMT